MFHSGCPPIRLPILPPPPRQNHRGKTSGWGYSLGFVLVLVRAAVPVHAASAKYASAIDQHFHERLVVRCQAFDLPAQVLGQRFGLCELRFQVFDRFFGPLHLLLQFLDRRG